MANLFASESIIRAIEGLDWDEVARRTLECAEEYMPGAAYLDSSGQVQYAETLREVDGLLLCMTEEPEAEEGEEEGEDTRFEVATWIAEVSAEANRRAIDALTRVTAA